MVNDDISLYLGNGSGNIVLSGSSSGKQNLESVELGFPEEQRTDAEITLSISGSNQNVDVWTSSSPGAFAQPILGNVNGTYVGSVTWTYGTTTDAPPSDPVLYVGATSGSADLNDIKFTLADSDANALLPPLPQTLPSPPPPGPVTANSCDSNPATAIIVQILLDSDPNQTNHPLEVQGADTPWMVGQVALMEAYVFGPAHLVTPGFQNQLSYSWDVPGNVLYNYTDSSANATKTSLLPNNGMAGVEPVGTAQQFVQFFWVTAAQSEQDEVVSAVVSGPLLNTSLAGSTTFSLYPPLSQLTTPSIGSTVVSNSKVQLLDDDLGPGIQIQGNVTPQMPAGIPNLAGQWKIVQLITPNRQRDVSTTAAPGPQLEYLVSDGQFINGQQMLDGGDPYPYWIGGANAPFPTGSAHKLEDSPGASLGAILDASNFGDAPAHISDCNTSPVCNAA